MAAAIFIDRDGVIIENRPRYVRSWEEVDIFTNGLDALAQMKDCPYKFIVVTNQAGIAHGLVSAQTVAEINQRLVYEVENAGGRIDGVYTCPHKPDDHCSCRKPAPGLFFQAAQELSLDLEASIVIGDKISDLQAGWSAGLKSAILVRTGWGEREKQLVTAASLPPVTVCKDLAEALNSICMSFCYLCDN